MPSHKFIEIFGQVVRVLNEKARAFLENDKQGPAQ
jgi:hypothetical protein